MLLQEKEEFVLPLFWHVRALHAKLLPRSVQHRNARRYFPAPSPCLLGEGGASSRCMRIG